MLQCMLGNTIVKTSVCNTPLSVIYLLVLHSLATRWYCEQMKPPEINPFLNHLAEKLKSFMKLHEASSAHQYYLAPGLSPSGKAVSFFNKSDKTNDSTEICRIQCYSIVKINMRLAETVCVMSSE